MLNPVQLVLLALAGWMNQRQQQTIEYLREENRVLREQLGNRRLRFNDDQRRRLAARAKGLGRKLLSELATLITPDTLLAWHRKLIAQKYDGHHQRGPGRPRTAKELESLVVRMADENRSWGYRADSGRTLHIRTYLSSRHDRCCSPASRDRASARTNSENDVEGVSGATLGADRSGGFFHRGGLDGQRAEAFPRPVLYGSVYAESGDCRDCVRRQRVVDEPDWQACYGCCGWHSGKCGSDRGEIATAIAKPERIGRAVCAFDQRVVSGPADSIRRKVVADSGS
jgi:hypothetical protein